MVQDFQMRFPTGHRMNNLASYSTSGIIRRIPHALLCSIFLLEQCAAACIEGFLAPIMHKFSQCIVGNGEATK